jgi:integrase
VPVDDLWLKGPKGARVPSERHGRGKRYRVRYIDDKGQPKQRLFAKKREADEFDAEVRSSVLKGTYVDPNAGKLTVREYGRTWLDGWTGNPSSREQMERRFRLHVWPHLGDHELRTLAQRPSIVKAWIRGLQSTLADGSIRPIVAHLSSMLNMAVDDGLILRNPCRLKTVVKPPAETHRVQPWSAAQLAAVRESIADLYAGTVDAGADIGLRQGEIFGLAVDDVVWVSKAPVVHVRRQVKILGTTLVFDLPKGDKERDVPMDESTKLRLSAHLQHHPARAVTLPWRDVDGPPVTAKLIFTNSRGGAIDRNTFNRDIWKKALRRAGLPETRRNGMHMLRHIYASVLLAGGVDIKALSEFLGHANAAFTLKVYTHLMPAAKDRAREAIAAARDSVPDLFPVAK